MRFTTWNIRSLYRKHSLKAVGGEMAKYKLDLLAVQEVKLDEGGSQQADDYTFFFVNGDANHL